MEHWIWLPRAQFQDKQNTKLSCMLPGNNPYAVCECRRDYVFPGRRIRRVTLNVSGDTAFLLFCAGKQLLRGPAGVGGDFLYNDVLRPECYAYEYAFAPEHPDAPLNFTALVRMGSVRICEYSRGTGGFSLCGTAEFEDGGSEDFFTDESWQIRLLGAYDTPCRYAGEIPPSPFFSAERKTPPVKTLTAPIPPCEEHALPLENGGILRTNAPGTCGKTFEPDKIYACYINVYHTGAPVKLRITGSELPGNNDWCYELSFPGDGVFYGMELQSVGEMRVTAAQTAPGESETRVELSAGHYPAPVCARTETSDRELNRVFEVCVHSLKYCRQSIHLDSPRHCEPLACTGDYYIETLMTAFTFGDLRLAAFDIRRTANLLRQHGGEMFHTSYSLIWVQMLWDVYRLTGDAALLRDNGDALKLLLDRFSGYIGETGLIETPPNYMFIDWLTPDGIDLHHPPKALGQTCMCMFYFGALQTAEKIYTVKNAVRAQLWDPERELFFEGLNTPTPESLIYQYMPQNVPKRYYRLHANALAAYFGFFGGTEDRALLERILNAEDLGEAQPYFQHFLLDAVYRCGLRETYTLRLLEQWKQPVLACSKGLPEGFYKPTPTYSFDRSHAWGGTPAYALPLAVTGLKMLEPGFKKISLSPSSLGLDRAVAEVPTPYGMLRVKAYKNGDYETEVPAGITVI